TCESAKAVNQPVIPRIRRTGDRLQSTGAVDMGNSGNEPALFFADLENLHHEGDGIILLKPFCDGVLEDGGSEWTKRFPPLDLCVEERLHIRPTRIAKN